MDLPPPWHDMDFDDFWDDGAYSQENYIEPAPSDALIAAIEGELGGYRLPAAYVALARIHNGGLVQRNCFPMPEPTSWADDHIAITGLYAIGRTATYSLCGRLGSTFMIAEWGYPPIGIGIADTPSAGHEQIMLDYRACGKQGEPQVVHVDQEDDYRITVVAPDFETFIRGLVSEEMFDSAEEDRAQDILTVERGTLSPIVARAMAAVTDQLPDSEGILRHLARRIIDEKGFFALHADATSHLIYDMIFYLYSALRTAASLEDFLDGAGADATYDRPTYELMFVFSLVADPYGFHTGGYAKGFLEDWWTARLDAGAITPVPGGYRMTDTAEDALLCQLRAVPID